MVSPPTFDGAAKAALLQAQYNSAKPGAVTHVHDPHILAGSINQAGWQGRQSMQAEHNPIHIISGDKAISLPGGMVDFLATKATSHYEGQSLACEATIAMDAEYMRLEVDMNFWLTKSNGNSHYESCKAKIPYDDTHTLNELMILRINFLKLFADGGLGTLIGAVNDAKKDSRFNMTGDMKIFSAVLMHDEANK